MEENFHLTQSCRSVSQQVESSKTPTELEYLWEWE